MCPYGLCASRRIHLHTLSRTDLWSVPVPHSPFANGIAASGCALGTPCLRSCTFRRHAWHRSTVAPMETPCRTHCTQSFPRPIRFVPWWRPSCPRAGASFPHPLGFPVRTVALGARFRGCFGARMPLPAAPLARQKGELAYVLLCFLHKQYII